MEALASLTPSALRLRLPELFAAIDAATEQDAPLVSSLAAKAFEGEEGICLLRSEECGPFVDRGLHHNDARVRVLTIAQLARLASSAADVRALAKRGILAEMASAVGDEQLSVAEQAATFFRACADSGVECLAAVIDDSTVPSVLRDIAGPHTGQRSGSVLELRAMALFASLAASGDAQFSLVASRGFLDPVLALWRGDDPLIKLNAVELLGSVATNPTGVDWLRVSDVLSDLCVGLDVAVGDDPMADLLRPAVLGCLAAILDNGYPSAAEYLLGDLHLAMRLWPVIQPRNPPEQLCAGLTALRAAAASPVGLRATLALESSGDGGRVEGSGALAKLLKAPEEHTRVCAMAVTAQLASTYGDLQAHRSRAANLDANEAQDEATRMLTDSMTQVFRSCSPSASTTAADAIANMGRSLSAEVRVAALELLRALAGIQWGAMELCASEGVLELLLTTDIVHTVPAEELRLKHAVASSLLRWPEALEAQLGAAAAKSLKQYVQAGPFAPQRPRAAQAAAPLTL